MKIKFPENFLWGAATSAYQVEGGNTNCDWYEWERSQKRVGSLKVKGLNPKDFECGIACDSYHRYDEDFRLAKELGHNSTRLGIEWSRIEPEEGKFNEKAFEHYEKVLQSAKFHGLKVFLTLLHFTNPVWFAKKGGFAKKENVEYFVRYASETARRLEQYVDFFITINEPEVYVGMSYLQGTWLQKRSILAAYKVMINLVTAHNNSAKKIRALTGKPISIAFHLHDWQPRGLFGGLAKTLVEYFANRFVLERTIDYCDYIGVNYYFHHHIGIFGLSKRSHSGHEKNDLGWSIHPEGIEQVLLFLKKYKKPIYITENGLADAKDLKREKFIKDHLYYVNKAMETGVDVRGYLHWSLIDNFEWHEGFAPRFGLIEIDRENDLQRKIRPSALKYKDICLNNGFEYLE